MKYLKYTFGGVLALAMLLVIVAHIAIFIHCTEFGCTLLNI